MLLHPYASSSYGNLYEVSDGDTQVLVECGLPYKRLQAALRRPATDFRACLVTHEHKDHSRSVSALLARGVECWMTTGTAEALGLDDAPGLHSVEYGEQFRLGTLICKAFRTIHDCAEPCGYLIHSKRTQERLLLATDTAYMRVRAPKLTEIAIECNYSQASLARSDLPKTVTDRIARTHLSVERAVQYLRDCDLSQVQHIWLLHLSREHADAELFRRMVAEATGKDVTVCDEESPLGERAPKNTR